MLTSFFEFKSGCACKAKKGHLLILPEFGHPVTSYESFYTHPLIRNLFNGWVMNYSNKSMALEEFSRDLENFFRQTKTNNLHVLCHGSSHVLLKDIPAAVKIILINPSFQVPSHQDNVERSRGMELRVKRGIRQYVTREYNLFTKRVSHADYRRTETPCLAIFSTGKSNKDLTVYYPNIRIEEIPVNEIFINPKNIQNFMTPIISFIGV